MIDTTQILLISAITIITIILTIIGIQLIFILKDLRIFLHTVNKITHEIEKIGDGFENGYHEFIGFFVGIKKFLKIIDYVSDKKTKK